MTEPIKLLVDYANWLADLKLRTNQPSHVGRKSSLIAPSAECHRRLSEGAGKMMPAFPTYMLHPGYGWASRCSPDAMQWNPGLLGCVVGLVGIAIPGFRCAASGLGATWHLAQWVI